MIDLGHLLREAPDELEADLLSEYGLHLTDMWEGRLSIPKVSRLASQLPAGSRVWKSLSTNDAWTTQDHIQALVFDTLQWANYQRGNGEGVKPTPFPRPPEAKAKADEASRKEAMAIEAKKRFRSKNT